jgi:hypothetical protein
MPDLRMQYMDTDTGGGTRPGTNTSNVVPYKSPYTYKSTPQTTKPATSTVTRKSTTKASATPTKAAPATTVPKSTSYKRSYTPYTYNSSPTYYQTGGTAAAEKVDNVGKNINNYLKLLNETYTNEAKALEQNAASYQQATGNNIAQSENQYNASYNNNLNTINNLENQNRLREAAINQSIADYYKNIIDSYNRSMGEVERGFNEGNEATARARNEAIELAAQLYAMGEESQNRQTEKDLRGQYLSYMNGMKNMNQRLAAMGYNGGASETAVLNALNGYESNRTDLEEARLAAMGQLRQQQMQSDSEAQQAYLNKLGDLISNRTNQVLGVESSRSANEGNYANMQQTAQNNFQNWASDITGKRTTTEQAYADAIRQLAEMRNGAAYNSATLANQAAQSKSDNYGSAAYAGMVQAAVDKNVKAKVKKTEAQKKKDAKKKEEEKKKKEKEKKKKK